jgi:hypothetical protein
MKRRTFVLGGVAGLVSLPAWADDPFLKDLKRERKSVGHQIPGGGLSPDFDVTGWELNVEEDDHTLFDFIITNSGPKNVRLAHCQPFTFGPWEIIERLPAVGVVSGKEIKHSWRCCNDSNFFFIEINSTGTTWTPVDIGNGSGVISSDNRVLHIEWHQPQEVHFEIRGRKGAESGHC